MGAPNAGKKGPLDVVIVYAFDCTSSTPDYKRVNEVYWLVQSKLTQFPGSCLSYIYVWSASNRYTTEKRMVGVKNILPESTVSCTKNMASGLPEAHRLINLSSVNPNGVILLFSDGSLNNKGDFFDKAEDFVSTVPVHTFTLGSDAYNEGLRTIAANSPGGTFNSIPIPDKPEPWSPISRLMDSILSDTMKDNMKPPAPNSGKGPLDVVVVYAFDCTTSTPDWKRVNEVYWLVQSKLAQFPGSCLSYLYVWLASNRYTTEKRIVGVKNKILPESTTDCIKNMASGLPEAHRLINLSSVNPNGIILLFSDGSANNKGDFFDQAEDFVSTVPVHTFTLGSDAYNKGLCTMAANSPGGTFNSIPIPDKPDASSPLSKLLDGILGGAMNDDEKPATWNSGSTKSLVSISQVKYFKDDAALTADTVTAEVEIKATSSTAVREGLDLVAVLDVSRRMAAKGKIDNIKNAMKFVIMKLTPVDRLSIVVFSDGAARLTPLRSMTPDAQKELTAVVDCLAARGGTNLRAGLETGLAVAAGRVTTTARTANIFLMSDGKQTVGDARRVDPGEVPVYTFGFGDGADHRLLSDLAARSPGGMFSAVPDGANLSSPFSQLLAGLLTVVAQDVQLTLTPKTGADGDVDALAVAPGTDYTQATDAATGVVTIIFGALFAGEGRRVVVTIDLKASAAAEGYDAPLAEAQHSFTAQGKVARKQTPRDIQILRTPEPSRAPGAGDESRRLQAELARRAQAEAIRQARLLADAGDFDEARYRLVDAQNALEDVVALNDGGRRLVTSLRGELVRLIGLMESKGTYEARGRAYALAAEASHGRQRYAGRGDDDDDVRLFSTPRMDTYLEQAKSFEKDPTAPVPTVDEDVKKEIAANPLAAISGDVAYYLRNAIEALQAMEKIIAPSA